MSEIFRHVLAVLPAFLLACIAVAALPGPERVLGATLIALGIDLAAASR